MPKLEEANRSMNNPVQASNCLGRFCFNIPEGTCIILFPGASILLAGIVTILVVYFSSSFEFDEFTSISILCLVIGSCMTLAALIYWLLWCQKYQKKNPNLIVEAPVIVRSNPRNINSSVELVGVYKINNPASSSMVSSNQSLKYTTSSLASSARDNGHDNEAMVHSPVPSIIAEEDLQSPEPVTHSSGVTHCSNGESSVFIYGDALDLSPANT